jgi:xylulokinase
VRAVYEGVTFGLVDAFRAVARTGVQMDEIVLVGGGSASRGWARLIADAIGLAAGVLATTEAAAIGAALQARWAVDGIAPQRPEPVARWEPAPSGELEAAMERFERARDPEGRPVAVAS